jgi:xanthine/uracil permease
MIGISLSLFAFGQITHKESTLQEMLISFMSLFVIIAVSIWGKRNFVIFATLIGMLLGALITLIFEIATTAVELEVPELAILYWPMDMPSFSMGLVPGILTGTIGCLVRCTGDIVASAQMTDQKWKRPDYSQISRGVMADGLGSLFAGLIGVIGTNTYSGSVGLVAASRVASRRIGFFIAAGWIFLAVMPNSALIVIWIPKGIFGATLFFVALFVIRSGINLLGQRLFDTRKTILVGSALALGLSYDNINLRDAFLRAHVHESVSAILLLLISGILLNIFFRIGIKKTREQKFIVDVNSERINQFLLECGQAWSARSEAIFRASAVGEEVNEYLNHLENPPKELHMKVSFDELTIDIEFRWIGLSHEIGLSAISGNKDLDINLISKRLMWHHSDKLRVRTDVSGESYLQVQIDDH